MSSTDNQPNHQKDVIFDDSRGCNSSRSQATQMFYDAVLARVLSTTQQQHVHPPELLPQIVQDCLYQWVVVQHVRFWVVEDESKHKYTRLHLLEEDRIQPSTTTMHNVAAAVGGSAFGWKNTKETRDCGGVLNDPSPASELWVVTRMTEWLNQPKQRQMINDAAACSATESCNDSDSDFSDCKRSSSSAGKKPAVDCKRRRISPDKSCSSSNSVTTRVKHHHDTTRTAKQPASSCGTCRNCTRAPCGACFHCERSDPNALCLQKVRANQNEGTIHAPAGCGLVKYNSLTICFSCLLCAVSVTDVRAPARTAFRTRTSQWLDLHVHRQELQRSDARLLSGIAHCGGQW